MTIRVLLAEDHSIVRAGLRSLLEKEPDIEVVAEAKDGRTTVRLSRELSPDVVIMDISMEDLNGVEATRQIRADSPQVAVLGLSMHSDEQFVVGMLSAGALGYLIKDCAVEELTQAIRTVVSQKTYLSPAISGILVKAYVSRLSTGDSSPSSILTTKEREVLQLLAEGKTSKQIASGLNLSVRTIENHRQQVMKKLDMHTIAELTKYAIRKGITSLES